MKIGTFEMWCKTFLFWDGVGVDRGEDAGLVEDGADLGVVDAAVDVGQVGLAANAQAD